jgi:hypothetical protein
MPVLPPWLGTCPRSEEHSNMRAAILICVVLATATISRAADDPRISAPDVDPPDGTYSGAVHVTMAQNAKDASIRYSVDGTDPKDSKSVYRAPFDITTLGRVTLRAVAVSDVVGRPNSNETVRTYTVTPGAKSLPEISPEPRTQRENITISINTHGQDVEYRVDLSQNYVPYSAPFVIDAVGHRTVSARRRSGIATEPVVTADYVITPPLRFDVSSSCEKCKYQPTRCEEFVVWLQGHAVRGKLMLTISSQGCETELHKLDNTEIVDTDALVAGYRFRTTADPGSVWVCLRENDASRYTKLLQLGSERDSFKLGEAQAGAPCSVSVPTDAPAGFGGTGTDGVPLTQSDGILSVGNVLFMTGLVCVVFVILRAHKFRLFPSDNFERVPTTQQQTSPQR